MRNFLIWAVLLYVLQLQYVLALSFSKLHSLVDKFIGKEIQEKGTDTTPGTNNEILMMDILLQLCQVELANRKIETNQNTNNNINVNNIQNVIQSPPVQQPVTVIIINDDTDAPLKPLPPRKRRGKMHILRRKYRWQREYRIVIELENSPKPRPRAKYRSKDLLVRTAKVNDKVNETVHSNIKDCVRMKLEELENKNP